MPVNFGNYQGWPHVNHAMETRGTQTATGSARSTIIYPRRKYTFLVEFQFNYRAVAQDRFQTNLLDYIQNGKLYASLRSIDHPRMSFKTEKLNSYNKKVIIPTGTEYAPATVSFHDDNASIIAALWKEYRRFYQYEGQIGDENFQATGNTMSLLDEFRAGNELIGSEVRNNMNTRPSMGLRMREDDGRHFFDAITIYDLGADPDSVNVYTFMNPMITQMDHEGLDYYDRGGLVGWNMQFDYEGYYQVLGINNSRFTGILQQQLNRSAYPNLTNVPGHVKMKEAGTATGSYKARGTDTNALDGLTWVKDEFMFGGIQDETITTTILPRVDWAPSADDDWEQQKRNAELRAQQQANGG